MPQLHNDPSKKLKNKREKNRLLVQQRRRLERTGAPKNGQTAAATELCEQPLAATDIDWRRWAGGMLLLAAVFLWAYWPTIVELLRVWEQEPDYSHGYLVVPVAVCFLWARREYFPGFSPRLAWSGLLLVVLSIAMRYAGALVYLGAVDAWSILLWVAGTTWFLGGWKLVRWSAPSIAFLWFMIPLPYRVERWLSLPLQSVATKLSCWSLQCLGQPALAEGHTILVGEHQLEVEEACSGLRIFVGIAALAFAYLVLVRRTWWEKLLLVASVLPIALIANATRIVMTGLLFRYTTGEFAYRFSHDFSGWAMIPFAAFLFAAFLWYLGKLIPEVEPLDVRAAIRSGPESRVKSQP